MELEALEGKTDDRGMLVEAFTHAGGQVHYIIINPDECRGNHYHTRKNEEFIVVAGSATITVKNRETGDIVNLESNASKPIKALVYPNYTHRIVAGSDGAVVISWNSEVFDPEDTDTYPEEI